MKIKEKLESFAALAEKAESLRNKIADSTAVKEQLEMQLSNCREQRSARDAAHGHRIKGLLLLAVAVILGVVEIMCLTETLIVGYSDLDFIDLIILLVPLVFAIKHLAKAKGTAKGGTDEELAAEIRRLMEELKAFEVQEDELAEIEEKMRYTGANWDFSMFRGESSAISRLEEDCVDLLIVLKYTDGDEDFITDCWLARNEVRAFTAGVANDETTKGNFERGTMALRDSGSWILQLINAVNLSLDGALMMAALDTDGEGVSFQFALETTKVRKPENEEEQIIWDLAHEVVPDLVFAVGYRTRQAIKDSKS